jgi:hypothetical protein
VYASVDMLVLIKINERKGVFSPGMRDVDRSFRSNSFLWSYHRRRSTVLAIKLCPISWGRLNRGYVHVLFVISVHFVAKCAGCSAGLLVVHSLKRSQGFSGALAWVSGLRAFRGLNDGI